MCCHACGEMEAADHSAEHVLNTQYVLTLRGTMGRNKKKQGNDKISSCFSLMALRGPMVRSDVVRTDIFIYIVPHVAKQSNWVNDLCTHNERLP